MKKWLAFIAAVVLMVTCAPECICGINGAFASGDAKEVPSPSALPGNDATAQAAGGAEQILKITEIAIGMQSNSFEFGLVKAMDEKGQEIVLPIDYSQWFDDASITNASIDAGGTFDATANGFVLAEGTKMRVEVSIGGVLYWFQLEVGREFHYTVNDDGQYKLEIDEGFTRAN